MIPQTMATVPGAPQRVYLMPGTLFCSAEPTVVTTVLGSCVSVCLWHPVRRVAGINHFLLPTGERSLRYGDIAIPALVDEMLRLGCHIGGIEAKVFGGAAVLRGERSAQDVGSKNIKIAVGELARNGIPVVAQRTGGHSGLSLRFLTATGDVLVRSVA
ncbi:chemotaxis protein CheD [Blastochloris viridis]|uniref:Probable chemoreceptor glutamine deamidase CheD n=1 Tax=Blastochloris viridis TaxID=1079 RepID=A0A0H5BBE9_BLAVI|nr:chemotaxis protein CheD [Blastochloris viridis]ALK08307.1 Chemoreceptor glutamine deamidase CheD [Blastochloris viridis]BAR98424.1 chemotaxis protein CheD [Blastochloris viridis]CUU44229.1 Chemoreceptor glutamine deamidase CheD [Blastochloris viridis]